MQKLRFYPFTLDQIRLFAKALTGRLGMAPVEREAARLCFRQMPALVWC